MKVSQKELTRISKIIILVLRNYPGRIGFNLDKGSWADVAELISKVKSVTEVVPAEYIKLPQ